LLYPLNDDVLLVSFNKVFWKKNTGGGEIFRTRPDRPSFTMGTGPFPGVKRPGRGADHPPPSSAEVENE
jgi:hypothetical protein